MKRMIIASLISVLAFAAFGQIPAVSVPKVFTSGSTIIASDMNLNFAALVQAIKNEVEPIGTVIASLVAPDANGDYMSNTGSNQVWAFADGTPPSGVTFTPFPDMRGQFIRGMNAGRVATIGVTDPDTSRAVGSSQTDAFQGHHHFLTGFGANGFIVGPSYLPGSTPVDSMVGDYYAQDPTHSPLSGPRVAGETRPTNIAVYWYIKVK
jgi:hypothetical protein